MPMKGLALRDWIGIALIFSFVTTLGVLFFKLIPEKNSDLITYMLGQLSGFVATVVGYHYVTSVSDDTRSANTGKAFDALKSQAEATKAVAPSKEE